MKYIATNGDMMKCPVVICHEFTIFHLRCNRRGRLVPKSRHAGLLRPDKFSLQLKRSQGGSELCKEQDVSRNDANISSENSCSCSCGRVLNLGPFGWLLLQRRWVKTRESWMLTNAHLTDRIDVLIHFPQDGGVMWNLNTPPQFGSSMVDFCAIHHLREGFIMFHLHVG